MSLGGKGVVPSFQYQWGNGGGGGSRGATSGPKNGGANTAPSANLRGKKETPQTLYIKRGGRVGARKPVLLCPKKKAKCRNITPKLGKKRSNS